jgi:hypothetical protein
MATATLLCTGGAKKPSVDLRIHTEGLAAEAPTFAFPAKLMNGNETYLARMPLLTHREIKAIYPFAAADGSQGVYLKLDSHGSGLLQQYSMARSGRPLVVFLNSRQISNLLVDRAIHDGIVCLPRGLTEDDINLLSSFFPVLGQEGTKKKGR